MICLCKQEWELFIGKKTTNIDEELNYKDNIPKWIDDNRAFDVYMLKVNIIYIEDVY
jgi:hypothetical protein